MEAEDVGLLIAKSLWGLLCLWFLFVFVRGYLRLCRRFKATADGLVSDVGSAVAATGRLLTSDTAKAAAESFGRGFVAGYVARRRRTDAS